MTKTVKLTITDEVWCTFVGFSSEHNDFLYNKYGVFVDGYRYIPAFQLRRWDGKLRFYEPTGRTYNAFLEEIIPLAVGWGYELDIDDKREFFEHPTMEMVEEVFIEFEEKNISLREYQKDAVRIMVKAGNGFVVAATGAGKSIVTAALAAIYGKLGIRTLTIVPSSDLVTQTYEWFDKCGLDSGEYSGSNKDLSSQHIVATWQSLQNRPELVKEFKYLLVDEAHQGTAKVLQSLIAEHGKFIAARFGVTGTFPKPETDRLILRGSVGNILKEIPASWLIANGYLAELDIEVIQLVEPVDEEFPDYPSEKAFQIKSPERLDFLANLVITKCEEHGNTLVLVNSVAWGKKLADNIEGAVFLSGASEKDVRRLNYDLFETKDDLIVIATFGIASTGLSIDRVFNLMLIDSSKSFTRAIQSVGRGLRKAKDKSKVHVVDVSSLLKYAKKHLKARTTYYQEAGYPFNKKPIKVLLK